MYIYVHVNQKLADMLHPDKWKDRMKGKMKAY